MARSLRLSLICTFALLKFVDVGLCSNALATCGNYADLNYAAHAWPQGGSGVYSANGQLSTLRLPSKLPGEFHA